MSKEKEKELPLACCSFKVTGYYGLGDGPCMLASMWGPSLFTSTTHCSWLVNTTTPSHT